MSYKNIFSEDKKGISAIIVTLLMIVLSLVAVGAVWVVINNVLSSGTSQIGSGTRCLDVDIKATSVAKGVYIDLNKSMPYTIALKRSAAGEDIAGVKLILSNSTPGQTSQTYDLPGNIPPLGSATLRVGPQLINATSIDVTVYFTDASGNQQLCSQPTTFRF